jgi:hypothetical protein
MENVSGTVRFVEISRSANMDEGRTTAYNVGQQIVAIMENVRETV